MNSNISISNEVKFMQILSAVKPGLYRIQVALEETGVNAELLVPVIRALGNLALGTGYGKVQIFMQAKIITQIKPEETIKVDELVIK